jgi:N,N'-diacetyllegionaminate synthase
VAASRVAADAGLKLVAEFAIAERAIGPAHPPYVVAEAGVNHNGDPALAIRLVEAAAQSGADAVKFQTFDPASLAVRQAPAAAYQRQQAAATSQLEMLRGLVLPRSGLEAAFDRSRELRITAFSTPFDESSLEMLLALGVPALKIGSGDLTDLPLLRLAAASALPLIVSTGMATEAEVDAAVDAIRTAGDPPLALLHCLSAYPAPVEETNLRAIPVLRDRFGLEVGFSDHTTGQTAAIAAVALGATIIEKHLTLDRAMPGPDHAASMEPEELTRLIRALREAHAALGDGIKRPQPSELETRQVARRSLVAARDLVAGTVLAPADLGAKRPGDGLSPFLLDNLVGRRLIRDLSADTPLDGLDVDPPIEVGNAEV